MKTFKFKLNNVDYACNVKAVKIIHKWENDRIKWQYRITNSATKISYNFDFFGSVADYEKALIKALPQYNNKYINWKITKVSNELFPEVKKTAENLLTFQDVVNFVECIIQDAFCAEDNFKEFCQNLYPDTKVYEYDNIKKIYDDCIAIAEKLEMLQIDYSEIDLNELEQLLQEVKE
ncbi:MAG: hypothetical protein WC549_01930 [Actinomycetota bacterium]